MPQVIDLSAPIEPDHFRWHPKQYPRRPRAQGHAQVTWPSTAAHAFTHRDAPWQCDPAGATAGG